MSLTLDPKKIVGAPEDELGQLELELGQIAAVTYRKGLAIVSLICNVQKTSEILMRVHGAGRAGGRAGERGGYAELWRPRWARGLMSSVLLAAARLCRPSACSSARASRW